MSSTGPFKIGDWLVEPELDRISRGTECKNLRPKVMELLVYLASKDGQVIGGDELLDHVWADKIVTGGSVYRCVGELREALSSRGENRVYVETIPKKGYRLSVPITGIDEVTTSGNKNSRLLLAIAAILVLIAALVIWTSIRPTIAPTAADFDHKSVAVLPFENLSADPGDACARPSFRPRSNHRAGYWTGSGGRAGGLSVLL